MKRCTWRPRTSDVLPMARSERDADAEVDNGGRFPWPQRKLMSQTSAESQAKAGEKEQLRQELLRLIVKNEALRRRPTQAPLT
jgi:hypothetical protein